jgi:hypothetical protein
VAVDKKHAPLGSIDFQTTKGAVSAASSFIFGAPPLGFRFAFKALTASSTYLGMLGKKPRSSRVIVFRAIPSS